MTTLRQIIANITIYVDISAYVEWYFRDIQIDNGRNLPIFSNRIYIYFIFKIKDYDCSIAIEFYEELIDCELFLYNLKRAVRQRTTIL
jgi:hypothetical protein